MERVVLFIEGAKESCESNRGDNRCVYFITLVWSYR